ncbi:hypothetical protein H1C71_007514 [Ictidomys tridecemlineatus]|nr:hypothetical protein H1C71_007514 [Ictidomys tridecemlineatus]
MTDSKEVRMQPLGPPGCLGHGHTFVLQLLGLTLFAGLLVALLVQVSKVPSSQEQEQELAKQEKVYQELTQLKAGVDRLCRPCPWDLTFFQGHCYFFSKSQRNWHDSATACQEEGAQLVVINSAEEQVHGGPHPGLGQASGHWPRGRRRWSEQGFQEQGLLPPVEGEETGMKEGGPRQLSFLQLTTKKRGHTWMGLSDLNKEATWHWVDGSPLSLRFMKYWNPTEPNNLGQEDCAEFDGDGWNDAKSVIMSDFKEARVQQLGPLEKGLMMASGTRSSAEGSGFQLTSAFNSLAGCLGHGHISLVLQLLCLTVLAGILVAALVQVSKIPSSQEQEQELVKQEKMYQELTQLKAGVDRLCRPCPWDWTFFQGHCYFFSKSQRNWHDSVITCQEEGAQLVVINSAEEQVRGGPHPGPGQASGHWPRGRRRWSEQGFLEQGLLPPVEGRRRAWTGGPRQLAGDTQSLVKGECLRSNKDVQGPHWCADQG